MILVRVFDTPNEAKWARKILEEGGIKSVIQEDKFNGVPIQKFNVPARYRLLVGDRDFPRTIKYLGEKIKAK